MHIVVNGKRTKGVSAKDIILAIIGKLASRAAPAALWNYSGRHSARSRGWPHDGMQYVHRRRRSRRMIAPDDTKLRLMEGRRLRSARKSVSGTVERWKALATDPERNSMPRLLLMQRNSPQVTGERIPAW